MRYPNLVTAGLIASALLSAGGAWAHAGLYWTSPVHDAPGKGRPDPWCLPPSIAGGCLGGFRFPAGHFADDHLEFTMIDDGTNPMAGLVAQDTDGDGISAEPGEPRVPFCAVASFSAFQEGFSLSLPIIVFVDGPLPDSFDIGPIPPAPPSSPCTDANPYHGGVRGIITHL